MIGLANLFQGGSELLRAHQQSKTDSEQMRASLLQLHGQYVAEVAGDAARLSADWHDPRAPHAQAAALLAAFCTYAKRLGLPLKQLAKLEADKVCLLCFLLLGVLFVLLEVFFHLFKSKWL